MPFTFERVEQIPDLIIVKPRVFEDDRGFFMETYKHSDFAKNGIDSHFLQDNYSKSRKGVIRGLHYQLPPKSQGKLVRVAKGKAYDVAVDIRRGSSTYLKWHGVELTEENRIMFYIPQGFAHGFVALTDVVLLHYKCTNEYDRDSEGGIIWNDPDIGIDWGIDNPIISEKDDKLPYLKDATLFD
jgi:dTDP-4-dehydrorhamnose 3,5-epimerase